VDLVETFHTGEEVRIFSSVAELRAYTRREKKIFPREEAKAGGLLKKLLRPIFKNKSS
jgi:hypothetical protein